MPIYRQIRRRRVVSQRRDRREDSRDRRGGQTHEGGPLYGGHGRILDDQPFHEDPRHPGWDLFGYDRSGFNRDGFSRDGYNAYGYDLYGFDRSGRDINGLDRYQRPAPPARPPPRGWASAVPPGGPRDKYDELIRRHTNRGANENDGQSPLPPYQGARAHPGERGISDMPRYRGGYRDEWPPRTGSFGEETGRRRSRGRRGEDRESGGNPSTQDTSANSTAGGKHRHWIPFVFGFKKTLLDLSVYT